MALLAAPRASGIPGVQSDRAACRRLQRIYRTMPYGPLLDIFALDLRSYRGGNSDNRQTALTPESSQFGAAQFAAVKARLARSRRCGR